VYTCIHIYTHTTATMYMHIHMYMCIHVYIYIHILLQPCICTHTCICVYMYTYIYTHSPTWSVSAVFWERTHSLTIGSVLRENTFSHYQQCSFSWPNTHNYIHIHVHIFIYSVNVHVYCIGSVYSHGPMNMCVYTCLCMYS